MMRWAMHTTGGPKRSGHTAVGVGHKVYSFGGVLDDNKAQIDVHVFNTVSLNWTKLSPTASSVSSPDGPSMSYGHTAVLIEGVIYIWGGECGPVGYSNVLHAFDVDTHHWFKPRVSGTTPEGRFQHSACVLEKVMYVYGGFKFHRNPKCTNDISKLDTSTMVWAFITTTGNPPPVSSYHTATIIGTKMFVFGGRGKYSYQGDYYNTIRVFDTKTDRWLNTPSSQRDIPEGRCGHSVFVYNEELFIFGGKNWTQTFNDLWKFNPKPGVFSWSKVGPRGKGPHPMYRMCCCRVDDRIMLFGGFCPPDDHMYILDLSPRLKTLCMLAVMQHDLEMPGEVRKIASVASATEVCSV